MKQLEAMKAVYTYFFPEVRSLVHFGEKIPDELYLTSTSAETAQCALDGMFKSRFEVPATLEGKVDLDSIHIPIIDKIVEAYAEHAYALRDFPNRYPMAGSSQGIFHLLAELKAKGTNEIYVLKGEYEGYAEYGKTLGINTHEIPPEEIENVKPGTWFISNPSARDGNIIPNEFITKLCENGHKIILDLAYVGSTKPYEFDISNENIPAVLLSFSKPYGVFRFRIGGFAFSRTPVESLYANKWFKDVPRLLTALKIVEKIPPGSLYPKYSAVQKAIVKEINEDFSLNMRASDALLLGYLKKTDTFGFDEEKKKVIMPFERGDNYRFCLTPYYEKFEQERTGK